MKIGRWITWIAVALGAASMSACQNADVAAPEGAGDPLTTAEAAAISEYLMNGAFQGWDFSEAGSGSGAALLAGTPITIEHAVTATAPCPLGGTLSVSGAISGSIDDQTFAGDLELGLTTTATGCAILHDGVQLSVDTGPDLQLEGSFAFDQTGLVGEATFTYVGALAWSSDDGRSGSCSYDVLVTADSGGSLVQSGTVCGTSL